MNATVPRRVDRVANSVDMTPARADPRSLSLETRTGPRTRIPGVTAWCRRPPGR